MIQTVKAERRCQDTVERRQRCPTKSHYVCDECGRPVCPRHTLDHKDVFPEQRRCPPTVYKEA